MIERTLKLSDFVQNGSIHYGDIYRYWRKEVLGWHNTATLVDLFNEAFEEDNVPFVSIRWWQRMEKNNKVPTDLKRRWVLATLIHIPPAYLGLTTATPLVKNIDQIHFPFIPDGNTLNLKEYQQRLKTFWSSPYETRAEALQRTYLLQDAFLYEDGHEHDRIGRLLCEYLLFVGNIERARGSCDSATSFLTKALHLSKDLRVRSLEAKALFLRGYSFFERWRVTPNRVENRLDLLNSINDCNAAIERLREAKGEKKFISQPLEVATLDLSSEVLAHNAQDTKDTSEIRLKLKKAETILQENRQERDPLFFDIDEYWCHIGKVQTLIGLGWSHSALTELTNLTQGDPRKKRRYLTRDIAEAEAYLTGGKVEIGVTYAEIALKNASKIGSQGHISRIACLYDTLRRDDEYTRNPDVIHLGIQLLKVQHPEVFLN